MGSVTVMGTSTMFTLTWRLAPGSEAARRAILSPPTIAGRVSLGAVGGGGAAVCTSLSGFSCAAAHGHIIAAAKSAQHSPSHFNLLRLARAESIIKTPDTNTVTLLLTIAPTAHSGRCSTSQVRFSPLAASTH